MHTAWNDWYAQRTHHMTSSAIRELLKITEQPDIISFAGGLPAPEAFPVEEIAQATQRVLQALGPQALQYGATEGFGPLRDEIAALMSLRGVPVTRENILITSGSQQALDLVGKIFLNPGDHVVVEAPTYIGALQAWSAYEASYDALPVDNDGMKLDRLDEVLQHKPKFIYALPNFQNPSGVTLSLDRRKTLVETANKYGIPILEDDAYSYLRYNGEALPSLLTLDGQAQEESTEAYQGNVIYLSTFSKILAPGMRLGWVVAHPAVIRKLVQAKQGVDLHTPTFTQIVAYEILRSGFIEQHAQHLRQLYRGRRDTMLAALEEHFPEEVTWTRPQGGMFLWVTLPEGMDSNPLLQEAIEYKVAFVPGGDFHPNGGGKNTLRLNFSNASHQMIETGIARLGKLFHRSLARQSQK